MIDIISKREISIPFKSELKRNINDVSNKVLIIDEELIDYEELKKKIKDKKKMFIIVILKENRYSSKKISKMYANNIDYHIRADKLNEQLMLVLEILENKHSVINRVNVDTSLRQLVVGEHIIRLTKREAQIYDYLAQNRGQLCLRKEILSNVLGYHVDADTRIVDVYIKHLRAKIKNYGLEIKTERGKGYILE